MGKAGNSCKDRKGNGPVMHEGCLGSTEALAKALLKDLCPSPLAWLHGPLRRLTAQRPRGGRGCRSFQGGPGQAARTKDKWVTAWMCWRKQH